MSNLIKVQRLKYEEETNNTNTQNSVAYCTIISMFFVPWILVRAWLAPLPDTVQEPVNEAIGHGFDGIIVYVDESGKSPAFYTAGWHDRKNKIPAYPKTFRHKCPKFKLLLIKEFQRLKENRIKSMLA